MASARRDSGTLRVRRISALLLARLTMNRGAGRSCERKDLWASGQSFPLDSETLTHCHPCVNYFGPSGLTVFRRRARLSVRLPMAGKLHPVMKALCCAVTAPEGFFVFGGRGRAIGTGSTACTEHPTALAGSRSEFHIPSSRFSFTLRHSVALYAKPTNKHMRSRPWSLQAQYRSRIATFYKGLVVGLGDGFIDEELSAAHHKDDARNYEQPRT